MAAHGVADVLLVLPAYNEQEALPGVLASIRESLPDVQVLVVDDGSADDTACVARRAGVRPAGEPALQPGRGWRAARTGLRTAQREHMKAVVQCDADGQHLPALIPDLLAALDRADLVIGARFAGVR